MKMITPETHKRTIIWLHGLGADGNDFLPIARELQLPEEAGIKFIFPDAPTRPITINGGIPMPGWYDIYSLEDRSHQDTTGTLESVQTIQILIESEIQNGIPPENIILAGFSQGGAIALYAGLTFPKKLQGILALSTYLPIHDSFEKHKTEINQTTPILMMHGTQDLIIPIDFAKENADYLTRQHYPLSWETYHMEHNLCSEQLGDIRAFILK